MTIKTYGGLGVPLAADYWQVSKWLEVFEMVKKSKGLAAYEAVNDVKLVTADEAALIAGVSRRGWYRFVSKGLAPKPIHIGRCARWKIAELFKWIDGDCHSMTSGDGGKS